MKGALSQSEAGFEIVKFLFPAMSVRIPLKFPIFSAWFRTLVGGRIYSKVEQYKTGWITLDDFPYASYIEHYSTVTIDGDVYIFGG